MNFLKINFDNMETRHPQKYKKTPFLRAYRDREFVRSKR